MIARVSSGSRTILSDIEAAARSCSMLNIMTARMIKEIIVKLLRLR